MAVLQTTYAENIGVGYPGQVANGETCNIISKRVEDAAGIEFGKFAWQGTADDQIVLAPSAGTLIGVTVSDKTAIDFPQNDPVDAYGQNMDAGVMTLGAVYITTGAAVTMGAQVYVTSAGAITDTAGGNVIAPGWFFDQTAASGAICRIARR